MLLPQLIATPTWPRYFCAGRKRGAGSGRRRPPIFARFLQGPILAVRGIYFRTASLSALDGSRRTTVLALILIASPVCGLRPMRALRCALTTRPSPGITNLPALPLASFTASLNSSSKKSAAVFLGVPAFSAMCETTFVLLKGLAAIYYSYPPDFFHAPRKKSKPAARFSPSNFHERLGPHCTIAKRWVERKGQTSKKAGNTGLFL